MAGPLLPIALARVFLAGEQTVEQIVSRSVRMLGRPWRWLGPLARRYVRRYLKAHAAKTRPRHRDVVRFLLRDRGFNRARTEYGSELQIAEWLTEPQQKKLNAISKKTGLAVAELIRRYIDAGLEKA